MVARRSRRDETKESGKAKCISLKINGCKNLREETTWKT